MEVFMDAVASSSQLPRFGGQVPVQVVPLQSRGGRGAAGPFLGDLCPLSVRCLEMGRC